MDSETFESIQMAFLKSYNLHSSSAWRSNQKEYKKLKLTIEKLLQDNKDITIDRSRKAKSPFKPSCPLLNRKCYGPQCAIYHEGPDCCAVLSLAYGIEKIIDLFEKRFKETKVEVKQ